MKQEQMMICRCEEVTLETLLSTMQTYQCSSRELKLRTRAGMGRCQGGFCSWRVMQLLSEQLRVPMEEITKRGGGSWIVCKDEEMVRG